MLQNFPFDVWVLETLVDQSLIHLFTWTFTWIAFVYLLQFWTSFSPKLLLSQNTSFPGLSPSTAGFSAWTPTGPFIQAAVNWKICIVCNPRIWLSIDYLDILLCCTHLFPQVLDKSFPHIAPVSKHVYSSFGFLHCRFGCTNSNWSIHSSCSQLR